MFTPGAAMPVLSLKGVRKTYPNGNEAIRDVSFEVSEGEFLFLSGPSGSGKTTLIRILLKMEEATGGEVLVFGRNVGALLPGAVPYLRRNIGVIFQDFRLLQDRTVFENLALGLHILGMSRKDISRRVEGVLYDLGIDRYADAYPAMLSGGEQQRVAIGRALVMEPTLILADEPTGNLDTKTSIEIMELFVKLNEESGITILLVTHEPDIAAYSKRTVRFLDGKIVSDESTKPS